MPSYIAYFMAYALYLAKQGRSACYNFDGSSVGFGFAPCNNNTSGGSMCCDWAHNDVCTAEGLCIYEGFHVSRDACTDPTWATCPVHLCPWNASWAMLLQCVDGSWCCGESNQTCCEQKNGVFLQPTASSSVATPIPISNLFSSTSKSTMPLKTTSAASELGTTSSSSLSTLQSTSAIISSSNYQPTYSAAMISTISPMSFNTVTSVRPVLTITFGSPSTPPMASVGSQLTPGTLGIVLGVGLGVGLPLFAAVLGASIYYVTRGKRVVSPYRPGPAPSRHEPIETFAKDQTIPEVHGSQLDPYELYGSTSYISRTTI